MRKYAFMNPGVREAPCMHPGNVSVGREMAFGAALGSREGRCLRTGEEREEEGRTLREPNLKVQFHDPRRPRGSARARDVSAGRGIVFAG